MGEQQRLKVGILGCGYQGGRLASAIQLSDSLVLTACMDIDPQAAAQLADRVGGAVVYSFVEDLLESPEVEVVMVATPHHALAEISIKAIQAGKHVLAEKPIALDDVQAARVEQALLGKAVCYMAGYSFRYLPAWQKVKELLSQGAVGEILAITGMFGVGALNDDWAARPETGGGPLLFVGSHLIDQVLWYLQDDPLAVNANVHFRVDTQADETSAFRIDFARGATAQLLVTQAVSSMSYRLDIYGRQGRIHLQPCGFLDYEITVTSAALESYRQPALLHPQTDMDPRDHMHRIQLNDFVEAIRAGQQPPINLWDGRRVLKVMDAVFESGRSGKTVVIA